MTKEFVYEGKAIYFLGKVYPLKIREGGNGKWVRAERLPDCFLVQGSRLTKERIKAALEDWYIYNARIRFKNRCAYFAPLIDVTYHDIRIKNQKSRWGSCSELCHRKYMNHSKDFWTLVESILPDYKERERWLRDNENKVLIW